MFQGVHSTVIGDSHIKKGIVCQDSSGTVVTDRFAIAVVADGHGTLAVMQDHRLRVGPAALTGGGIAHMAGGHLGTFGQLLQHTLGENLADKAQIAVAGQHAVNVQRNAAALLAAVLQGVQRTVDGVDHIGLAGLVIHTEHAALLVQTRKILW